MKKIILFIFTITILTSCAKQKSETIVKSFILNLSQENFKVANELYPNFVLLKRYNEYQDLKITGTERNKYGYTFFCKSKDDESVSFSVCLNNDKYIIESSKGLSAYIKTNLYKYCQNIGCINSNCNDEFISQVCIQKQQEYNELIEKIKLKIENSVRIENHTLRNEFGFISGSLTYKNNSNYTIPSNCYDLYLDYLNQNGKVIFTSEQKMQNYEDFQYSQIKTISSIMESCNNSFSRVKVKLIITNTNFIESLIAEYAKGSNGVYSDNL